MNHNTIMDCISLAQNSIEMSNIVRKHYILFIYSNKIDNIGPQNLFNLYDHQNKLQITLA